MQLRSRKVDVVSSPAKQFLETDLANPNVSSTQAMKKRLGAEVTRLHASNAFFGTCVINTGQKRQARSKPSSRRSTQGYINSDIGFRTTKKYSKPKKAVSIALDINKKGKQRSKPISMKEEKANDRCYEQLANPDAKKFKIPTLPLNLNEQNKTEEQYLYIKNWVPRIKGKKLLMEGDLLDLDNKIVERGHYLTSEVIQRLSSNTIKTKHRTYVLEGRLNVILAEKYEIPKFIFNGFFTSVPERWILYRDHWSKFNEEQRQFLPSSGASVLSMSSKVAATLENAKEFVNSSVSGLKNQSFSRVRSWLNNFHTTMDMSVNAVHNMSRELNDFHVQE